VGPGGRGPSLDLIHTDGVKGEGDLHGVIDGEGNPGCLLAIPQRRVAEAN
jgi:hypothetical protein